MREEGRLEEVELDADEAGRFRRPRRPVAVRPPARWKAVVRTVGRVLVALVGLAGLGALAFYAQGYALRGRVFQLESREGIEVVHNQHVADELVHDRFFADLGGSLFQVPLEERRLSVEEIPWVETASVHRFLPNRLRVELRERSPVAFLRQGRTLWLVDAHGVVLPIPPGSQYNFPVLTGVPESLTPDERRARVALYRELVQALDEENKQLSRHLSEVDVSQAEDIRATVTEGDGAVRLHFGRDRYREKFENFLQHRHLWKQSGEAVRSVDLRYRGQIVLNPDSEATKP